MKSNTAFLLVVIAVALFSCSKDDESPRTMRDYLTQKPWRLMQTEDYTYDADGQLIKQEIKDSEACQKESWLTLRADSTVQYLYQCQVTQPVTFDGRWGLMDSLLLVWVKSDVFYTSRRNIIQSKIVEINDYKMTTRYSLSYYSTDPARAGKFVRVSQYAH